MLKMKVVYTKTGTTSWDYFLDANTVPLDSPVYTSWKNIQPNLYGKVALGLFAGIKFTFNTVSNQEIHVGWEIPDVPTYQAWVAYFSSFDATPAVCYGFYEIMTILYAGETFGGYLEIIEATPDLYETAEFIWMKTAFGPDALRILS
jgi:hypothetical protein